MGRAKLSASILPQSPTGIRVFGRGDGKEGSQGQPRQA